MKVFHSIVVICGLFALGAEAKSFNLTQPKATFHNPILDYAVPDPFVYRHDGFYYMAVSRDGGIVVYKSALLSNWRNAETRLVYRTPGGLANLWAPELINVNGNWYIYFALDNGDNANHRMYVIRALDPNNALGDYTAEKRLSTPTEDFWAIDGTVLKYGNGQLYFIWSGWPTINAGFPQNLYIAPMSDPETISGNRVLLREPRSEWETIGAALLEGPEILQHNGRTFLIFSASGSWTADYCLGMIGIDGLKDPLVQGNWWQDVNRCVFWRNDEQNVYGTGHASFTTSPDGSEDWIVYHAMETPDAGWGGRTSRVEKFIWNPDGSPGFPRPSGFGVALEAPRGE